MRRDTGGFRMLASMTDEPTAASSYFTLDFTRVDGRSLEEMQAQAAELWLRYRPDERVMLSSFFRSIMECVTVQRRDKLTHILVEIKPDPTDPLEQIDSDLGTAMARIRALTEDPRTGEGARTLWLRIAEEVRDMRGRVGKP